MAGPLRWAALTGLYLALAGQFSVSEIVAGILAGAAAMALSLLLRRRATQPFRLSAPWHRLIPLALWSLLRDVMQVAKALLIGRPGKLVRQPFAPAGDDAAGAGRKALTVLLTSLTPNGVALAAEGDAIEVHRLADTLPRSDRAWPL